jgi:ribosomal protein L40E
VVPIDELMALGLQYICRRCGNRDDAIVKSFELVNVANYPNDPKEYKTWEREHLRWLDDNTRTYICDRCWVRILVPRALTLEEWERWKEESARGNRPYGEYPFLVALIERIDGALRTGLGSNLDLGPIKCPYCSALLAVKTEFSPTCRKCGSSDMVRTDCGVATIRGSWPPVA